MSTHRRDDSGVRFPPLSCTVLLRVSVTPTRVRRPPPGSRIRYIDDVESRPVLSFRPDSGLPPRVALRWVSDCLDVPSWGPSTFGRGAPLLGDVLVSVARPRASLWLHVPVVAHLSDCTSLWLYLPLAARPSGCTSLWLGTSLWLYVFCVQTGLYPTYVGWFLFCSFLLCTFRRNL